MAAPMKCQTRVVGWKNKDEFKDTYISLYDANVSERIDGIGRVNAWKCRFADKMPVAIECTSTLLEATLLEEIEKEPSKLQLMYSMAIIRFVNLMTGYLQNKAQAQPVVSLAKEIRLPEWLVELRHEASHKHLPPLGVLRLAAKTGLAWLQENFWEKQLGNETESVRMLESVQEEVDYPVNINGVGDEIRRLCIMYQQAQYKDAQGDGLSDVAEILSSLQRCLTDPEAKFLVVSLLLQDGYLVPTSEQLQALLIEKGICYNYNIMIINRVLCQFWKPLILLLNSLELIPLLLQGIIKELGRFKCTESKAADYLVGWAMQLVMAAAKDKKMYRPHLMLFKDNVRLPWKDLFDDCISQPNKFTLNLLQYILPNLTPKLSEEAQHKVRCLSSIYGNTLESQEPVPMTHDSDAVRIYTEEDIPRTEGGNTDSNKSPEEPDLMDENHVDVVSQQDFVLKEEDQFQPWSLSTADADWSAFPIGSLPGQSNDPNTLVLDVSDGNSRPRLHNTKYPSPSVFDQQCTPAGNIVIAHHAYHRQHNIIVRTHMDCLTKRELENIKKRIQVF